MTFLTDVTCSAPQPADLRGPHLPPQTPTLSPHPFQERHEAFQVFLRHESYQTLCEIAAASAVSEPAEVEG